MTSEKQKIIIALGLGLTLGAGIGGGVGYVLADRRLREATEKEIAGVKNLFARLREEDAEQARMDWSSPVDQEPDVDEIDLQGLAEKTVNLGYGSPDNHLPRRDPNYIPPTEQELDEKYQHPFVGAEEDARKETELKHIRVVNPNREVDEDDVTQWDRSPNEPYVITEAEFRIDRPDHEKLSINYYKGDNTLTEADDSYIPDLEGTVGEENLNFFGLASGDEHVLHVRNERVGADFEVTLNEGAFSREVLGFGIEEPMVKESKKNIRKMRSYDQ